MKCAAFSDSPDIIDLFLEAGGDIEVRDNTRCTPLEVAACFGKAAAVVYLLERGAEPNVTDARSYTPIMEAVAHRFPETVRPLLPVSDLSITNRRGRNVLHVCITGANDEIFSLLEPHVSDDLLDARTLPGIADDGSPEKVFTQTALHLACDFGRHAMVEALLRRGASRVALDSDGCAPLHYAVSSLSCVVLMLGQPGAFKMTPAEVNLENEEGLTALYTAARTGLARVCGLLIQAGARLDAASRDGQTPLMIAQQEHPDNAMLLELLSGTAPLPLPGTACERCAAIPDSALLHCAGCLSVRYCCPRCAAADWPRHASFCKERKEARWRTPDIEPAPSESESD